ncbi:MAG: D-alanine--D-alanine ligase, partial [Ghiorsea sp.]
DLPTDTRQWMEKIGQAKADIAFVALHGTYGEDGCVQGMLEIMQIPYTGSSVAASALCMNKSLTKQLLQASGIVTPSNVALKDGQPSSYPVFIKPIAEGSSVGLHYVDSKQAWLTLGELNVEQLLLESCIEGVEIAISVLDGKALPAVEVVPESGVYDFAAKYTQGATAYYCPARLSQDKLQQCMAIAEQAVAILGCSGASRVDLIVTESGEAVVLEVNTIPGMTATSLLPKSAAESGINFTSLCVIMVQNAALLVKVDWSEKL